MDKRKSIDNDDARVETARGLGLFEPDFVEAYDNVVTLTQMGSGMPICVFSVVGAITQYFKSKSGLDHVRETPREHALCNWTIGQDDPEDVFVIEDARSDPRTAENPLVTGEPGIGFYAGIGVRAPNQMIVGTVCLIDHEAHEMSEDIRRSLKCARSLLEDALVLRSQSVRDHLTGLFNRRFFDEGIQREWRRAYRQMLPLTVMLADVDHFKAYNDTYGHQEGDDVLRRVAEMLNLKVRRAGDMIARYGGEEFVLVLPETDIDGAVAVADQIVDAVRDLGIPHSGGENKLLSISVGGAVAESKADLTRGELSLLTVADEALYQAKRAGRSTSRVRRMQSTEESKRDFVFRRSRDAS